MRLLVGAGNERAGAWAGDFTRWDDHDAYQQALDRLLRDLRVEEA